MKVIRSWTIGPLALALNATLRWWMSTLQFHFKFEDRAADPRTSRTRGIYLLWHEMMMFPAYTHRRCGFAVLCSHHQDGEFVARLLRMLGFAIVRGSTSGRSISVIRELVRQGKAQHLAITPDGPTGPRRIVQPGAIYVASRTGMPIFPIGFAFGDCWRVGSWDRMAIAKPWTRGYCVAGKAIYVPPDLSLTQMEKYRLIVQGELDRLQASAEAMARSRRRHGGAAATDRSRTAPEPAQPAETGVR
jgi:lysophospholipid acyltransferase (LPLAT)-like uncharacterized protein